jgi:hypothetical protein
MFKRIVLVRYETPEYVNELATTMIQQLLVRNQSNRLGNLANGYLGIKNQPWYVNSGISFMQLIRKKVDAPWKPEVKEPKDASFFDRLGGGASGLGEPGRRLTKHEQEVFKGF